MEKNKPLPNFIFSGSGIMGFTLPNGYDVRLEFPPRRDENPNILAKDQILADDVIGVSIYDAHRNPVPLATDDPETPMADLVLTDPGGLVRILLAAMQYHPVKDDELALQKD